jgi:hypothetical protein
MPDPRPEARSFRAGAPAGGRCGGPDRGIDGNMVRPRLPCDDGLVGGDTSECRAHLLAHPGVMRANMRLVHRNVTD